MKKIGITTLLLALLAASSTWAGEMSAGSIDAKAAFEKLKSFAGTWEGKAQGDIPVQTLYKVTANGSVVMQTQFAGTDHEMINMFHMVGSDLVATHYCAAGNQPHFKFDPTKSTPTDLNFAFDGGTSFDPAKDGHVHTGRIVLTDDGKLKEEWSFWAGGKEAGTHRFEAARR